MKLTKKSLPGFLALVLGGILIGSLFWEVIERLLLQLRINLSLTVTEPIQIIDFYVIKILFRANIGSLFGSMLGFLLFKLI